MKIKDIKQALESDQYDFIRKNEHLGNNIILLTLGGSHAYGTNNKNSDLDIRGCALNSKKEILTNENFEQFINEETDTTIYSFNKLITLLSNCNPNTIEMLGNKPEHYLQVSKIGQEMLDNKKMFLSKRAINSFGGYANQQLRRLQNALAHDKYPQEEKERHILGTLNSAMYDFAARYAGFEEGEVKLYLDKNRKSDFDTEIFMDISLRHYPLRDYKGMWSEMQNIVKSYDKLGQRNSKKDDAHLNKHAMHLIRLYLMCLDILENEEIVTYREKEHCLLMDIRNGKYQKSDGTFHNEFFEMVDEFEKKMKYATENTNLPKNPNYKAITEFTMSVNERVVNGEF